MFNLQNLKQLIYEKLANDATLIALLGGNSNIFHFHPQQASNIPYPIIVYNILGIEDNVYDSDRDGGINACIINIDIFSSSSTTEEADNIADRVYALLHNQNLSNTNVLVYTCYRDYQDENFDESSQCWRINAHYEVTNVAK